MGMQLPRSTRRKAMALVVSPTTQKKCAVGLQNIYLPTPPSTNELWATTKGGRRVKTDRYKAWIQEACLLMRQRLYPIAAEVYPVTIIHTFRVAPYTNWGRDEDNLIKAIHDGLVSAEILVADNLHYVWETLIRCRGGFDEECMQVQICPSVLVELEPRFLKNPRPIVEEEIPEDYQI